MAGVGLGPVAASPEFARDFGKILRIVVEGLVKCSAPAVVSRRKCGWG
jgi:hypothetical protein